MTESNNREEKPRSSKEDFFRIAQLFIAGGSIFLVLCYFLGRLHIEAYYSALGITPHVLDFKPEDYMFFSFNLVIMCLFILYWVLIFWRRARLGRRLLFGMPFVSTASKSERALNVMMIITTVFLAVLIIIMVFYTKQFAGVPGLLGMGVGFALGVLFNFFFWFLETVFASGANRYNYTGLFIIVLLLIAYFPTIVTNMAEVEADRDLDKFPQAIIYSEYVLPPKIQSSIYSPRVSSVVKVITTNNKNTYVLKQGEEKTNEWQIYSIPQDNINQIEYLYKKE